MWSSKRFPALVLAGVFAFTAPPASADVFNACMRLSDGRVRASSLSTDVPQCKVDKEAAVSWNEAGPQGPPGPSGAFATFREIGDSRGSIPISLESFTTVGSLALPAGAYVVSASLYFTNDSVDNAIAYCVLTVGGNNAQAIDTEAAHHAVSQALTAASVLSAEGTATLSCRNNGGGGNLAIETFNLNAIMVGNLTFE